MKDHHTTATHFEVFKKECRKWIAFFELSEWKIYFDHINQPDKQRLAACCFDCITSVATLVLNKDWKHNKPTNPWIKWVARHEVVHLLIGRLQSLGESRFVSEDEMAHAAEATVHNIEHIIDKLEAK